MRYYNTKNERMRKEYFHFLKEAHRKANSAIDEVRTALRPLCDYGWNS